MKQTRRSPPKKETAAVRSEMTPKKSKLLVVLVMACLSTVALAYDVKIGLLIPFKHASKLGNYFHRGEYYASAISIAVDDINRNPNLLPGHNVSFVWNDTQCEDLDTVRALVHQLNSGVNVLIGPACSCNTSARIAAAFNVTMISYVSLGIAVVFFVMSLSVCDTLSRETSCEKAVLDRNVSFATY